MVSTEQSGPKRRRTNVPLLCLGIALALLGGVLSVVLAVQDVMWGLRPRRTQESQKQRKMRPGMNLKDFAGNEIDVPAALQAIAAIDWSQTTSAHDAFSSSVSSVVSQKQEMMKP